MYETLKCAGQTLDDILQEHPLLQTWKAMNSNGIRGEGKSKMLSYTLVIIIKGTFCNFQNFVVM